MHFVEKHDLFLLVGSGQYVAMETFFQRKEIFSLFSSKLATKTQNYLILKFLQLNF